MSSKRKVKLRTKRRSLRTHHRIRDVGDRHRVVVRRSNRHMHAQLIDDAVHNTVASSSTLNLGQLSGDKKEQARLVGKELASRAQAAGINSVKFDRGGYSYHGRVMALAEGLREAGLEL